MKIHKEHYVKLKSTSITAKETINRLKRQLREREKIFANYVSDKSMRNTSQWQENKSFKNGQRIQIDISQKKT